MNTKIKQYLEVKELQKYQKIFSKLESYLIHIQNGGVVTHDEILDALGLRLINDYQDQTNNINQLLSRLAKQNGITILKEKGCYALAEPADHERYQKSEGHEQKAALAFGGFLVVVIALSASVFSQYTWLTNGLIGLAGATLLFSLYHTFHTQNIILLGEREKND